MPRSPHRPLLQLRVRPSPCSRLYVQVQVFPTVHAMHHYGGCHHGTDYRAITLFPDGRKPQACSECLCEIRLCRRWLHPSLIAHEMAHAALGYLARIRRLDLKDESKGVLPYDHPEEVLCRALQRMVGEALIQLEVAGLEVREPVAPIREDP